MANHRKKLQIKTAKTKPENTFIFRKETTQKTDSNMDQEEYHLLSKSYYPDDLETSEAGISESQEAIDDFINKQKSKNTKGRSLLISTLYSVLLKLIT